MSTQYRSAPPPCPLCGSSMEDHAASDAVVDVCSDCHAVWIDWFDGDIATVAGDVHVSKAIPANVTDKHPCPRCRTELVSERLYQTGPYIFRCADCSGVLVPSAVIDEVVALGPSEQRGEPLDAGPLARMLSKLRKVFRAASH